MIGTDENRAVLHVEVIFWSGKRKAPQAWSAENIVLILLSQELRNLWVYAFWTELCVHLMDRLWGMPSLSIRILWITVR